MQWTTAQAQFSGFFSRFRWSKLLPIAAGLLLAIALARFANSYLIYYLNSSMPEKKGSSIARVIPPNTARKNVDPTEVIGGPLFSDYIATSEAGENAPKEQSNEPFELIGTLEGHPSFARAVIKKLQSQDPTKEYATGAKIGNARIIYIGREYIWIRVNGQKQKVKVGEKAGDGSAQQTPAAAVSSNAVTSGEKITKVISREEVNSLLKGNASQIYKGASFGPHLENGKIAGYRLHKVQPTHIFYKLGARPGDIIRQVNGHKLSDTETMFELWKSIKTAPQINVVIERNKKMMTFDFHIRN